MSQAPENATSESVPRVISTGIDTLAFTAPLELEGVPGLRDRLRELQEAARAAGNGVGPLLHLCGVPFQVAPTGAGGYDFKLVSEEAGNILVAAKPEDGKKARVSGIKCELGSYPLWRQGAAEAYRSMRRYVCDLFKCADGWPSRATRIDWCVDFQGWRPSMSDALSCVSRSSLLVDDEQSERDCGACGVACKSTASFCSACGHDLWCAPRVYELPEKRAVQAFELAPPRRWHARRILTGLTWGSGKPLMLRIYDKTVEIRDNSPDKAWFGEVWRAAGRGYVEGEPVMRLEVEGKRTFLKSLRVDGRQLETVEEFIDAAPSIFRYLIGSPVRVCKACGAEAPRAHYRICRTCGGDVKRPQGWLELRVPDATTRPSRWPVHPAWTALQRARFEFSSAPAYSTKRVRDGASREVVRAMSMGTMSTHAALAGAPAELAAELGRRPNERELAHRTLDIILDESDPGAFDAGVRRKLAARNIVEAGPRDADITPRDGLGPTTFRRQWRRALEQTHEGAPSAFVRRFEAKRLAALEHERQRQEADN